MVPKEMGILKGEMLTPLKTEILSPTSLFFHFVPMLLLPISWEKMNQILVGFYIG
jgi:hypothetical protein